MTARSYVIKDPDAYAASRSQNSRARTEPAYHVRKLEEQRDRLTAELRDRLRPLVESGDGLTG